MTNVSITYIVVEEPKVEHRATVFHLLSESDIALLRCFGTMLLLPGSTSRIIAEQPPFVEAISRLHQLPTFRKASARHKPHPQLWNDMLRLPLLVLMVASSLPPWFEALARQRAVAVLSPSDEVTAAATKMEGVFAGLLRGMADVREFYRVLGQLAARGAADTNPDADVRSTLATLGRLDLFGRRPRLAFIPGLPLPQPGHGRPAAYLFNRLSNNVDEPSLQPVSSADGLSIMPQMLNFAFRACVALGGLELGEKIPPDLPVKQAELEDTHGKLVAVTGDSDNKFRLLMELGRRLTRGKWPEPLLLAAPVPRIDLLRGRAPETVRLDSNYKRHIKSGMRALKDLISGTQRTSFRNKNEKREYESVRWTLLSEQRLLACQTAWLAGLSGTVPVQLEPLPWQLYNAVNDLNRALEANSRKIPSLFRGIDLLLSEVLPKGLLDHLKDGDSPVTLFSDLPLEWTLIDEWPLCLTRPVSRIPIGFSNWATLSAALEHPASIDTAKPERVLVFDLIEAHDPVRSDSDAFVHSSDRLGQKYTYVSPTNVAEFKQDLQRFTPEIVVLDAHGGYDRAKDKLTIELPAKSASLDELLPDARVPPVWILSACDTSVTGAVRGCFVRELLARGAVCIIATLSRVDAFTASMFVGRLLTDIYNPAQRGLHDSLDEVFFGTQYTTALLYDPLLPLLRRAQRDSDLKKPLGEVFGDFLLWARGPFDFRKYRYDAAWVLGELLAQHGLAEVYAGAQRAGLVRPETLLFTAFGLPGHVELVA